MDSTMSSLKVPFWLRKTQCRTVSSSIRNRERFRRHFENLTIQAEFPYCVIRNAYLRFYNKKH